MENATFTNIRNTKQQLASKYLKDAKTLYIQLLKDIFDDPENYEQIIKNRKHHFYVFLHNVYTTTQKKVSGSVVDVSKILDGDNLKTEVRNAYNLQLKNLLMSKVDLILNTIKKDVEKAINTSTINYIKMINTAKHNLYDINNKIAQHKFDTHFAGYGNFLENERIDKKKELNELEKNKRQEMSILLKTILIPLFVSRSTFVANQEVHCAESISRHLEASIINNNLKNQKKQLQKIWDTILDDRTRHSHETINGQIRNMDDYFNVGNEIAMYPRDPKLSIGESANCRCDLMYSIINQ